MSQPLSSSMNDLEMIIKAKQLLSNIGFYSENRVRIRSLVLATDTILISLQSISSVKWSKVFLTYNFAFVQIQNRLIHQ